MLLAQSIVYLAFAYVATGILFSIYFSFFKVKKVDLLAKRAGIGFRFVIFFGVTAFWPIFAWRIFKGKTQPKESTAHRKFSRENEKG
mgnify:CR=1 FL=1